MQDAPTLRRRRHPSGRRLLVASISAVLVAEPIAGWGSDADSSSTSKTLTVGTSGDFPPWEFRDDSGKVTGWMAEVVETVAKDLGFTVEWKQISFTGLVPALQSGRIDLISTLYDTPERRKVLSFIDFAGEQNAVVVRAYEASDIKGWLDLCGKAVGSLVGTPTLAAATRAGSTACTDAGRPGIQVTTYQTNAQELKDLEGGRINAGIDGGVNSSYTAAQSGGKVAVAFYEGEESIAGWGLNKGSLLLEELDKGITDLLASDGAEAIAEKWALPPDFLHPSAELVK
jgi:polar amino acid transport system substrate-binding protein